MWLPSSQIRPVEEAFLKNWPALETVDAKAAGFSAGFAFEGADNEPVCAVLGTTFKGIGGAFGLATIPLLRGRGLGRGLMEAVLEWMQKSGARQAALQVVKDNKEAITLYHSLGFETAYSYHYRILPESA